MSTTEPTTQQQELQVYAAEVLGEDLFDRVASGDWKTVDERMRQYATIRRAIKAPDERAEA